MDQELYDRIIKELHDLEKEELMPGYIEVNEASDLQGSIDEYALGQDIYNSLGYDATVTIDSVEKD